MRPGYAVGDFQDRDAELERLQAQAGVAEQEDAALRKVGLPEEGLMLDIGCGPGYAASRLASENSRLRVIGVDRDAQVLAAAAAAIPALAAEATALPFRDTSFDLVHLRLVLRHLGNPGRTLVEAHRVLRPHGRVIAVDTDDDTLVLDPAPAGFSRVLAARQETFARRGADPFIGRRLSRLLVGAGFADISVVPLPLTSFDIGPRAFASVVLAPIADAIDPDLCSKQEVHVAATEIRAWGERNDVFGMLTALVVGGSRPGNGDADLST